MSEKDERPVSVAEFKAMIQGIDLLAGEKFQPNPEQWKRIRSMIDRLEDTPQTIANGPATITRMIAPNPVVNPNNPLDNDAPMAAPAPPGGVPAGQVVQGASTSALTPNVAPPPPAGTAEDPLKTPDIDSSDGYKSGYV